MLENESIIPNLIDMTRSCLEGIADATNPQLLSLLCGPVFPQSLLEDARLVLIDLHRLADQLADGDAMRYLTSLLSAQEQQLFGGFSYPKRRVEWLGGRLAAKCALVHLLGGNALGPLHTVSILPDVSGRPVVTSGAAALGEAGVTLSHGGGYAAAVACGSGVCGVDIQYCSERLVHVQERFAPEAEVALLEDEPDQLARLAILWTAKEAMKKCFLAADPTFFGNLRVVGAKHQEEGRWVLQCRIEKMGQEDVVVHVLLFDRYSLACVQGGRDA